MTKIKPTTSSDGEWEIIPTNNADDENWELLERDEVSAKQMTELEKKTLESIKNILGINILNQGNIDNNLANSIVAKLEKLIVNSESESSTKKIHEIALQLLMEKTKEKLGTEKLVQKKHENLIDTMRKLLAQIENELPFEDLNDTQKQNLGRALLERYQDIRITK